MMKFIQNAPAGGPDGTTTYDVLLDKPCTFAELAAEILTKNEWGYIHFCGTRIEYRCSAVKDIRGDLLKLPVKQVKASGSWGRMDYYVE